MSVNHLLGILLLILTACEAPNSTTPTRNQPINNSEKATSKLNPYAPVDVSPMDVCYFPVDFQKQIGTNSNLKPLARIFYSRPQLQGRHVYKEVVPLNQPWRLGANEATELQFFREAIIQNKRIPAGRYSLYAIPGDKEWTLVINRKVDNWGLNIDSSLDVARFVRPIQSPENQLEYFTIAFFGNGLNAELLIGWDNSMVKLPIRFEP
jgi:hypothetical protein